VYGPALCWRELFPGVVQFGAAPLLPSSLSPGMGLFWISADLYASTSCVERQNLNLRMGVRRFTRLTNAFSKNFENHCHMVAIYPA